MSLVVSRKEGESLCIGRNIKVLIESVDRGKIAVRVNAPSAISVDREEVRERKLAQGLSVECHFERVIGQLEACAKKTHDSDIQAAMRDAEHLLRRFQGSEGFV